MTKLKHKVIKLKPTDILLEVFIGKRKDIIKSLLKDYGEDKKYWKEMIDNGDCTVSWDNHIFIFMTEFDVNTIVHEATHATWYLDEIVGFNINQDNDEIQAYYMGYIVEKIFKMK